MADYLVTSDGNELGWYEAQNELEALDLAAQDNGYDDYADYEAQMEEEGREDSYNAINIDQPDQS